LRVRQQCRVVRFRQCGGDCFNPPWRSDTIRLLAQVRRRIVIAPAAPRPSRRIEHAPRSAASAAGADGSCFADAPRSPQRTISVLFVVLGVIFRDGDIA